MADARRAVVISVPDDFPSVFEGTPAHERTKGLGEVRVHTARGADDEAELIRRIDRARIAINIRAHARFTDGVFAACKNLRMVSIWGTGTDNVELEAAGRRGITVTPWRPAASRSTLSVPVPQIETSLRLRHAAKTPSVKRACARMLMAIRARSIRRISSDSSSAPRAEWTRTSPSPLARSWAGVPSNTDGKSSGTEICTAPRASAIAHPPLDRRETS